MNVETINQSAKRVPVAAGLLWAMCLGIVMSSGCTSLTSPISGIPARRLPPQFFAPPKNNLVPVDISLLSQEAPRNYILDSDDVLGVYIEGVLPFNAPDVTPQLPPVHFPDADSTLPPSIGFPIAVAEDGTISLPLVEPIDVRGMTIDQVRELVRQAYIKAEILKDEKARPVVTLIKERTYDVIVVRQDQSLTQNEVNSGSSVQRGSFQGASGSIVKLPAYQNDVLHALMQTGGLPGVTAKNEVKILRASQEDKMRRMEMVAQHYREQERQRQLNPCFCPPQIPEDDTAIRIPLRIPPGAVPNIRPQDVLLKSGDIIYIESRDREVFYTGGLLPGGEHPLPRDYDLDVLGAMAIAGTGVSSQVGGGGGGGLSASSVGGVPPGRLFILRKTPCEGQVVIEVDLAAATNDPRQRPLVQAGDILVLQYKCEEEVLNFGLGTFFTYGIQELLRN
ncbi:Polysaccharide biosynthesis/export protein [Rosistilla ulvae]|uniref:Polysaccharide biosynthesis/export protein n=2 Tax=Rosistilla ulvae TaxID=1930277 RepID=A0A517M1S0_9BACT|nr:Polysaccharide biosynthesis/export protein [Rosistilla ulvae]